MGTDIHMLCEYRLSKLDPWRMYKGMQPSWYMREVARLQAEGKPLPEHLQKLTKQDREPENFAWHKRNYDVFAILANVRNGYGFAGVPTGDGFDFISAPRGIPEDLSEDLRNLPEYPSEDKSSRETPTLWSYMGDHSQSWLLLSELLAFPWKEKYVTQCGVIPLDKYIARLQAGETGQPYEYSDDVLGRDIRVFSEAEAKADPGKLLAAVLPESMVFNRCNVYVRVSWRHSYADAVGPDFMTWLAEAEMRAAEIPTHPTNFRLVFGFDS